MRIDALATREHYAAHLLPIWLALDESERGTFHAGHAARAVVAAAGVVPGRVQVGRGPGPVMVAAQRELRSCRNRPAILLEHGAGQHYGGEPARKSGGYAGGSGRETVRLFLVPSVEAARRNREVYPQARVEVVGVPKMDRWHAEPGRKVSKDFTKPPTVAISFHWDLVPEGQLVSGPQPTGVSVRRYRGPIVDVKTRGGAGLSVSPDHPVLTLRGWVRAGVLVEGDHLVSGRGLQGIEGVSPYAYLRPARVENVAGALLEPLKVVAPPMPTSAPQLDDDGTTESHVDVVGADGLLRDNLVSASFLKEVDQSQFGGTRLSHVEFASGGTSAFLLPGSGRVNAGEVMGPVDNIGAPLLEDSVDGGLPDTELARQIIGALPRGEPLNEVTSISRREYDGHGYDFTTVPRWYEVNGFVVHNCKVVPEARWAWPHFEPALAPLAERFNLIGHGHPRAYGFLSRRYRERGIEAVRDFDEVLERADVYVIDNSSTGPEFASTDRPVVWMNAPWYRHDVEHGGRFWKWAEGGVQVDEPGDLAAAITEALADSPPLPNLRKMMVDDAYAFTDGQATDRAVAAIRETF